MTTETIDQNYLDENGVNCYCEYCAGDLSRRIKVVKRPEGDYIIVDGRLYTGRGAPVSGGWETEYHVHENIAPMLEDGGSVPSSDLWPLQAGVFDVETTVDMWRALHKAGA